MIGVAKGIDVSGYNLYNNGPIDWKMAKEDGVEFAILKAIRKDLNPDKQFENNWKGCTTNGIPIIGVYDYSYATTATDGVRKADRIMETLGDDRHTRIYLDWEDRCLPHGKEAANIINAYGDVVTAGGCEFGLYFGMSYYDSYLDDILKYVKEEYKVGWEARYYNGYNQMTLKMNVNENKRPSHFDGLFLGWQYSSSGRVEGITGNVDLNMWYVNVEADKVTEKTEKTEYSLSDFIQDSREIWKVSPTAFANEIVEKTVTVSTKKNASHDIVTPLERYMGSLGYYKGSIEADRGKTPLYGNGMLKATKMYQEHVVKAKEKNRDGELTERGATWRRLYGAN